MSPLTALGITFAIPWVAMLVALIFRLPVAATARAPLVLNNGEIQQLQAGDTLNAPITQAVQVSQTADATTVAGNIVYTTTADHFGLAKADAAGTSKPLGFATAGIASSASGIIQTDGILALTTTQWDAVAGTTGGLTAGTDYYLDPATAGKITATAPSTTGQYVVKVGRALSTTELDIRIRDRILL